MRQVDDPMVDSWRQATITEEDSSSSQEVFGPKKINRRQREIAIQTSKHHFARVEQSPHYRQQILDRHFSTDFKYSSLYNHVANNESSNDEGVQVD